MKIKMQPFIHHKHEVKNYASILALLQTDVSGRHPVRPAGNLHLQLHREPALWVAPEAADAAVAPPQAASAPGHPRGPGLLGERTPTP